MNVIPLTPLDLSLCAILILLLAASSIKLKIGIHKQLLISAVRCTIQLRLVGVVLEFLFASPQFVWLIIMAIIMLLVAGHTVCARQQRPLKGWWMYGIGTVSMCISSFTVTYFALQVIINTTPWYTPQYAIPLLGMLLGNTMNGIAISIDRLTQSAWQQRAIIEQRLALGHTRSDALSTITKDSMRSGMIPIINTMATTGIVSLPGMMTGQILAGSLPIDAVKYQILIIFLIAVGTGFGVMAAVQLTSRRLFDERQRLRLDRYDC
jgi:putative ABC transport system permease protein